MTAATALKVLIVVTSHAQLGNTSRTTGWYLPEVAHPYYALTAQGIQVDFVSPKGGRAPIDESSRSADDAESVRFLADPLLMNRMENTYRAEEINPKEYRGIIYAGGHGTMWDFPNDQPLARLAAEIYENGGVVAAVCHGPAALVNIKLSNGKYLVDGKKVATFTEAEEKEAEMIGIVPFVLETKLRERGARIQLAPNWSENVAVDGRLITGQNPASAARLGTEVVRALKSVPSNR